MGSDPIDFGTFSKNIVAKFQDTKLTNDENSALDEAIACIWDLADTDESGNLDATEQIRAKSLTQIMLKFVGFDKTELEKSVQNQTAPQEQDPFAKLSDFDMVKHPAKTNVRAITINGESVVITANENGSYSLVRGDGVPQGGGSFGSVEQLLAALSDQNNNFGKYGNGLDVNDVEINDTPMEVKKNQGPFTELSGYSLRNDGANTDRCSVSINGEEMLIYNIGGEFTLIRGNGKPEGNDEKFSSIAELKDYLDNPKNDFGKYKQGLDLMEFN